MSPAWKDGIRVMLRCARRGWYGSEAALTPDEESVVRSLIVTALLAQEVR